MNPEIGDLDFGAQRPLDPSRGEDRARRLLSEMRRVAILGASNNELRKSFRVVRFLADQKLEVQPMSEQPVIDAADALEAVATADSADVAAVFCRPEEVGQVAVRLERSGIAGIWFQEGLIDPDAARCLETAGKTVVMDRCIMRDYRRFVLGQAVESWFPV